MPPARLRQGQRTGGVLHPSKELLDPWNPCFPWQSPPNCYKNGQSSSRSNMKEASTKVTLAARAKVIILGNRRENRSANHAPTAAVEVFQTGNNHVCAIGRIREFIS